ncbi:FAD-binding domain-containing protein [Flavobacterium sp.]
MEWPTTKIEDIIHAVESFNPRSYAQTRNFKDGKVSRLSPYISRGLISTKFVYETVKQKFDRAQTEKFFQELLWRDYFQRLLQSNKELHSTSIRQLQQDVTISGMPIAILNSATGIHEIDNAINELYETGYMHNHARLYVASLCCNVAKSRFTVPAKWMYYHLLDGDIASNFASWQWVAGSLTAKKYYANQQNINFYSNSIQSNTFLDKSYEELQNMSPPLIFKDYTVPSLSTYLPETEIPALNSDTVLVYNSYNLDPFWHRDSDYDRILIFEHSHFAKFPVSEKVLEFICKLAENIPKLIIYCGEFSELKVNYPNHRFIVKEHPVMIYEGAEVEERDWIIPEATGFYSSFSKYYLECLKYLSYD